jgi:hypothetical protein
VLEKFHNKIKNYIYTCRYFLSDTILEEVTFGWPRQKADAVLRGQLALKLQHAINSVFIISHTFFIPHKIILPL